MISKLSTFINVICYMTPSPRIVYWKPTLFFQHRLVTNGTTTACYFGSLDYAGTMELVRCADLLNQRALIGKVSMNVRNKFGYFNNTVEELKETNEFIRRVRTFKVSFFYYTISSSGSCTLPPSSGILLPCKFPHCISYVAISTCPSSSGASNHFLKTKNKKLWTCCLMVLNISEWSSYARCNATIRAQLRQSAYD